MEAVVAYVEALQRHMSRGTEMEFIIHTVTCRVNSVMRGKQEGERRQQIRNSLR